MHGTRSGIDGSLVKQLADAGISFDDALALRKISMTLHRWHELECGDGNQWASWCIVRGHWDTRPSKFWDGEGKRPEPVFAYDDAGKPYLEKHLHSENHARYTLIADRENGAKRRLARIMSRYPALRAYIQTDPRGCALYILPPPITEDNYSRGIAVYK